MEANRALVFLIVFSLPVLIIFVASLPNISEVGMSVSTELVCRLSGASIQANRVKSDLLLEIYFLQLLMYLWETSYFDYHIKIE